MMQITDLSKQDKPNTYQIVHWIHNTDEHADELSHKVTCYFMAQPIKPVDKEKYKAYERYIKKLALLHEMLVYAMKAKQTTFQILES
jgi:nickel superoxide dismutase